MPSDVNETPPGAVTETTADRAPTGHVSRRGTVRKRILLAFLVLLLALLSYGVYYFVKNKSLPIPGIAPPGEAVVPPQYIFSITGSGQNQLKNPVGVGVARDGRVYTVDFDNKRVSVFDQGGGYLFSFNKVNDGDATELRAPVHLAIAPDGTVWVTDRRLRGIYVFSPEGKFIRKFLPNGDAKFVWTPLALAFGGDGTLRVTNVGETDKHEVIYFDKDGKIAKRFGRTAQVTGASESPGMFYFPNGVTIAPDGRVYIADGDNRRVQVFDDAGEFKQFVGTSGIPRGVVIDDQDRLYVVDALAHQIDMYSLEGESLTQFGEQGFGPGQFNYPNDIALFQNRIFITDRGNNQVQVWGWPVGGPPPLRPPTTPLGWLLCLSPLLLLPLLLLLRRRRFAVSEDFVDAMVEAGEVQMFAERRFRFVTPETEHGRFVGRIEGEVDLGKAIQAEPYSDSDAKAIAARLEVAEDTSIMLAVARRTKGLCTEDAALRKLAVILDIPVHDHVSFIEKYARKRQESDAKSGPSASGE